jgi:ribosomal protein L37AE/L43A
LLQQLNFYFARFKWVTAPEVFGSRIAKMTSMFRPAQQRRIEDIDIVLVDETTVERAEEWITACEHCSENAPHAMDYLLDALTGCDPTVTEYVMYRPACCPFCTSSITEKTSISV